MASLVFDVQSFVVCKTNRAELSIQREMLFLYCFHHVKLKVWHVAGDFPGDAINTVQLPGGDPVADGGFVDTKMRRSLFYTALAGEVIFNDSNEKFQFLIEVTHKIAPYSVRVQLLGGSSHFGRGFTAFFANKVYKSI